MFYSPYSGTDANCGNPLIISIDELVAEGLLDAHDVPPHVPVGDVDFPAVTAAKAPVLKYAAARLLGDANFKDLRNQMTLFRSGHGLIQPGAERVAGLSAASDVCG